MGLPVFWQLRASASRCSRLTPPEQRANSVRWDQSGALSAFTLLQQHLSQNDRGHNLVITTSRTDDPAESINLQDHGSRDASTQRSVAILRPVHIRFVLVKVLLDCSIGTTGRFRSICPVRRREHINCFMNSTTCRFTEPKFERPRERFFAISSGQCALNCKVALTKPGPAPLPVT